MKLSNFILSKVHRYTFKGGYSFEIGFERSTLKGKKLLRRGANSFLLE